MKKLFFLLLLFVSCINRPKYKKPFIIIYKFPYGNLCNGGCCSYEYIDSNGETNFFCDDKNKYNIGDTIK